MLIPIFHMMNKILSDYFYFMSSPECDSYHHIEHGHVDFTGWTLTYDHMVPFTCNPGYETEDLQFLRCMSNGNWSTASCRPKGTIR